MILLGKQIENPRRFTTRICGGFSFYIGRQLELIAAVRDGADGIARPHLLAELADDVDHGRAAVLRELVPYGLVDLLLCENPAGMPGQEGLALEEPLLVGIDMGDGIQGSPMGSHQAVLYLDGILPHDVALIPAQQLVHLADLSLIHISEPTRRS